jgi:hypothetical protein
MNNEGRVYRHLNCSNYNSNVKFHIVSVVLEIVWI